MKYLLGYLAVGLGFAVLQLRAERWARPYIFAILALIWPVVAIERLREHMNRSGERMKNYLNHHLKGDRDND